MESIDIEGAARRAQAAARQLAPLSGQTRRKALYAAADAMEKALPAILEANAADVGAAEAHGRSQDTIARLRAEEAHVIRLVRNMRTVADFADPIGESTSHWVRPNGLEIERVRVPVGVVGVCVEERPISLGFIAAACIKAADAAVFVTDGEAPATTRAIHAAFSQGFSEAGLPDDSLVFADVGQAHLAQCRALVGLDRIVDVAILRGSQGFVRDLAEHASVPVLLHRSGVCHVYVDRDRADDGERVHANNLGMAVKIVMDSRLYEPTSCTSAAITLVHSDAAPRFLPLLAEEAARRGLPLFADSEALKFLPGAAAASAAAFSLGAGKGALVVGIVPSLQEAVNRINANGAHLCDAIVTESKSAAKMFQTGVDSAIVFVNAATAFADGGQFGMGALVGISTGKLGPRGEIGIEGLTSLKYLVRGNGQIRGRA